MLGVASSMTWRSMPPHLLPWCAACMCLCVRRHRVEGRTKSTFRVNHTVVVICVSAPVYMYVGLGGCELPPGGEEEVGLPPAQRRGEGGGEVGRQPPALDLLESLDSQGAYQAGQRAITDRMDGFHLLLCPRIVPKRLRPPPGMGCRTSTCRPRV